MIDSCFIAMAVLGQTALGHMSRICMARLSSWKYGFRRAFKSRGLTNARQELEAA